MSKDITTELAIPQETAELYVEANREIARHLGKAPGPQVLMALVLQKEDAMEFARDYCELLLGNYSSKNLVL